MNDLARLRVPRAFLAVGLLVAPLAAGPMLAEEAPSEPPASDEPVTEWSLEDLASIEVTSVSRRPERQFTAAAPIYVITPEEMSRAGVTTLAEALRLAPGVQVARINSNQWAVGVRGFASRLSRSLLVLIDGRSVYTPLFAGVYWEDLLLDDVDRIEVIRGPGGTLWGSNAVNGVINVITKRAEVSQGTLVRIRTGSEDRFTAGLRYGGAAGQHGFYRIYAKYFDRDAQSHPDGDDFDAWRQGQAGFRADWDKPAGTFTLEGAAYAARNGQRSTVSSLEPPFQRTVSGDAEVSAAHLLGRYQRTSPGHGTLAVQLYYDRAARHEILFEETRDTVDIDVQHRLRQLGRHELIVGGGYRVWREDTEGIETVAFDPATRTDQLISAFVHDDITLLSERLRLALGIKLERNDYSGLETQPSASLLWTPSAKQTVWASLSRAVRSPSPVDHDLALIASLAPDTPLFARVLGDRDFKAEELIATQVGYRVRVDPHVLVDLAGFYHSYDDLLSIEPGAPLAEPGRVVLPFQIANQLKGNGRGGEVLIEAGLTRTVRVSGSYSYLRLKLEPKPGSLDTTSEAAERASPRHQGYLRATYEVREGLTLNAFLRAVGELPSQSVPAYANLDLKLGWQARQGLDLALVGRNLLEPRHLEFGGQGRFATEIQRAVYGEASVRW